MFAKIADEDRPYYDQEVRIPSFGDSTSDYDEGNKKFICQPESL